jgi:polyvinyl alcohol dehydrogenase (cytochrome)
MTAWRLIGYDEASTYFNREETKLTKQNAAQLQLAWQADMGGNVYGAPLQVGDRIYASGAKDVRAFEAASGKELWRAPIQSSGSLAYGSDAVFINNSQLGVVALQASDGARLWTKQVDAQHVDASSSPVVWGDRVFIGASNGGAELTGGAFHGFVAALDRATGANVWTAYTVGKNASGAGVFSSVSLDPTEGRVYATTANNYTLPATDTSDAFLAFDIATGELVWKNQRVQGDVFETFESGSWTDSDFAANPVLYEAMVEGQPTKLVAAGNKSSEGAMHALRRADGSLLWTRKLGEGSADGSRGLFASTTWSGKHLLVACNEGGPATLYALDGATGNIVWRRALEFQVWGRISVANGVGFVGVGRRLEVFDVDTGELIKTVPSSGGTVAGTITIANGRVAFGEGLSWSSGFAGKMLTVLALP